MFDRLLSFNPTSLQIEYRAVSLLVNTIDVYSDISAHNNDMRPVEIGHEPPHGVPTSTIVTNETGTLSIKLRFEPKLSLSNSCKEMSMVTIKS